MFGLCLDSLYEETIDGVPIRKLFVDNLADRVCDFPYSYAIYFINIMIQVLYKHKKFFRQLLKIYVTAFLYMEILKIVTYVEIKGKRTTHLLHSPE